MFFYLIGVGVFFYGLIHCILACLCDSDILTAFYEQFGKPIGCLKGKVVFITGASSGIGEHLAVVLAKHGVKLVITARRKEELERVKKNCVAASGHLLTENDVLVIPMDVTDIASHQKHFDYALNYFGTIDVLVNNAGRSQRALWEEIQLNVDKEIFDLNVFSTLNLSRIFLRYFNKRNSGHIAVNSSIAGFLAGPYSASYMGSKHAIHGYYNALRAEKVGRGITVTLFCPGPTFSQFLQNCLTADGKPYGQQIKPTDRLMTGERCAHLCAVALANKLNESWMALFPIIPLCYIVVYFPLIYDFLLKTVGPEKLFKF